MFFDRSQARKPAVDIYGGIVGQARIPLFYEAFQTPDTPGGRFDMILIHMFLVISRLNHEGPETKTLSQDLYDLMFADMDRNLREMGVGDVGVPIRIRKMAEDFQGRMAAYEAALAEKDDRALIDVLDRNLYQEISPGAARLAAMATYVREQHDFLADQDFGEISIGNIRFRQPSFRE